MQALIKWWQEFRERAPLDDDDMQDFCCVVVGNKTDLIGTANSNESVSETEARHFLQTLVPLPSDPQRLFAGSTDNLTADESDDNDDALASSQLTVRPSQHLEYSADDPLSPTSPLSGHASRSNSIAIIPPPNHSIQRSSSHSPKHRFSKSRSRSSYSGTATTHTTIYHTPSSSFFFDYYQSARSSPEPSPMPASSLAAESPPDASSALRRLTSTTNHSIHSTSTITPSLFAREQAASRLANGVLDHGPKVGLCSSYLTQLTIRSSFSPLL